MNHTENTKVSLSKKSLASHTFITGSTGSGKSNTVYQMLSEMHQDRIPFLVVEPAKGEYKDVFGNWVKKSFYKTKDDLRNLGHGNESVLILLKLMPSMIDNRTVLEAVSRHMGFTDLTDTEKMNYSNFLQNPLVLLLQLADQSASSWYDY